MKKWRGSARSGNRPRFHQAQVLAVVVAQREHRAPGTDICSKKCGNGFRLPARPRWRDLIGLGAVEVAAAAGRAALSSRVM